MSTSTKPNAPAAKTTEKVKRAPVDLIARTKAQLSAATLKGKLTVEQLDELTAHAGKLKSLLA